MKTLLKSLALLGALTLPSHAIFGIGGHWAPGLGAEVEKNSGVVAGSGSAGSPSITLDEKGASGLQGFGGKIWIDALPLIELHLSGNVQFTTYDASIVLSDGTNTYTQSLAFDLGPMFPKSKLPFGRIYGDAAVLYPFLKLPPLISLLKLYGGAGLTYGMATEVMGAKFAKSAMDQAIADGSYIPGGTLQTAATSASGAMAKAIKDEGLSSGMGGFLQLGARAKPPVVPIAVYLDFKYHFLGFNPDPVSGGLTMEMGGALAF